MSTQARKPRGTPVGGQFASQHRAESTCNLEEVTKSIKVSAYGKVVTWQTSDGKLQDSPSGEPALRWFRPDGSVEYEAHYQADQFQDPPSGEPAARGFSPDGSVEYERHYQAGKLQDTPLGEPAAREFFPTGRSNTSVTTKLVSLFKEFNRIQALPHSYLL